MAQKIAINMRLLLDIILLLYALHFPWWITSILVLAMMLYYDRYYEAIVIGFIIDVIFGSAGADYEGFSFIFTISFALVVFVISYLRQKMRFSAT